MCHFLIPPRRLVLGAVLCLAISAVPALATVNLKLERRDSDAGRAKVCVSMDSAGVDVAGTQNEIHFDTSCAALVKKDCVASEHHGKPLHGSIPASDPSSFRSLVFALDNVDPMSDGEVYCCNFTLTDPGDGCCEVTMGGLGASDPTGVALEVTADPGKACLVAAAAAAAVDAAVDAPGAAESHGGGGGTSLPSWMWIALLGVGLLAVLFFALRKSSD